VALLSIDFHALETDVRKEISLRTKVGSAAGDSILVPSLNLAPALEFERSDATRRLRLVLAELIVIMGQVSCSVYLIDFVDTSVLLVVPSKASFVWKI
jgi:integrator complex subunit 2